MLKKSNIKKLVLLRKFLLVNSIFGVEQNNQNNNNIIEERKSYDEESKLNDDGANDTRQRSHQVNSEDVVAPLQRIENHEHNLEAQGIQSYQGTALEQWRYNHFFSQLNNLIITRNIQENLDPNENAEIFQYCLFYIIRLGIYSMICYYINNFYN